MDPYLDPGQDPADVAGPSEEPTPPSAAEPSPDAGSAAAPDAGSPVPWDAPENPYLSRWQQAEMRAQHLEASIAQASQQLQAWQHQQARQAIAAHARDLDPEQMAAFYEQAISVTEQQAQAAKMQAAHQAWVGHLAGQYQLAPDEAARLARLQVDPNLLPNEAERMVNERRSAEQMRAELAQLKEQMKRGVGAAQREASGADRVGGAGGSPAGNKPPANLSPEQEVLWLLQHAPWQRR